MIETEGNTPENLYIQSLEWNGRPMRSIQLPFADIVRGGRLHVVLGAAPATDLTE